MYIRHILYQCCFFFLATFFFHRWYLRIHLSIRITPFPFLLCLLDLAIQISLVRFSWFAGGQRFVLLSFYVSLKGQHKPNKRYCEPLVL